MITLKEPGIQLVTPPLLGPAFQLSRERRFWHSSSSLHSVVTIPSKGLTSCICRRLGSSRLSACTDPPGAWLLVGGSGGPRGRLEKPSNRLSSGRRIQEGLRWAPLQQDRHTSLWQLLNNKMTLRKQLFVVSSELEKQDYEASAAHGLRWTRGSRGGSLTGALHSMPASASSAKKKKKKQTSRKKSFMVENTHTVWPIASPILVTSPVQCSPLVVGRCNRSRRYVVNNEI